MKQTLYTEWILTYQVADYNEVMLISIILHCSKMKTLSILFLSFL